MTFKSTSAARNGPLSVRARRSMLFALLDRENGGEGLPRRLRNALRQLIVEGKAAGGERLPSSRQLADEIGVSRQTVEAVYQDLECEGFLVRRHGSGTFVAMAQPNLLGQASGAAGTRSAADGSPSLSARGEAIQRSGGVNDHARPTPFVVLPDVDQFPVKTWLKLSARAIPAMHQHRWLYANLQGFEPLRDQIARYLAAYRGVQCDPDQVMVLNSSQQALMLIAMVLVSAGEPVAMEEPGYHGAMLAFRTSGARIRPIPVDGAGIDVERLRAAGDDVRAAYVTPSNQYPLSVTLSLERRHELLAWAASGDRWIIEDDYDSEFRYDGRHIASLQSLDRSGRVIYVGTFSKVLFPGLRLSYVVLPKVLVDSFVKARTIVDGHSPVMTQAILCEFMRDGHFTRYLKQMRQIYAARRDIFARAFATHLAEWATCHDPPAGLHAAVMLKPGIAEADTIAAAAQAGIELPSLSRLYAAEDKRAGWLMGFAAMPPDTLERAMVMLRDVLRTSIGPGRAT